MNTVRYWDYECNRWATGLSVWDGKALPFDNSGWQQKEPLLPVTSMDRSGYISQDEMRQAKHVVPADMGVWSRSAGLPESAPSVLRCPCGVRLTVHEASKRMRRCRRCRETNRVLRKPRRAA